LPEFHFYFKLSMDLPIINYKKLEQLLGIRLLPRSVG
jgi:hypothetical protein